MKSIFALIAFFFLGFNAFGQLSLQSGEQYLHGLAMKKVVVSYDDHTLWALSQSGQVYIKRDAEVDFSLYSPMIGEAVDDLAGYDETDMYFLIKPNKLIQVKNNIKAAVVFPGTVSDIRNIAVVLDGTKNVRPDYFTSVLYKDRLAVATNEYLYVILRGETTPNQLDIYKQPPAWDIKDFSITRTGIKAVEFKGGFSSSGRCFGWDSDYSVIKTKGDASFLSVIPDKGAYPAIRCTLFDFQSSWSSDYAFDFWGTAQGLYVKRFGGCEQLNPVKTAISGQTINSVDAIRMLSTLERNTFVLAATDNGLYYTPQRIYANVIGNADVNQVNFLPFSPLSGLKTSSFTVDFTDFVPYIDNNSFPDYYACEKVIWLATDDGVKKLYALFDGDEFQDKLLTNFWYTKTPSTQNGNDVYFNICSTESVEVNSRIPENLVGPLLIQWYKDNVEMPELVGKVKISFNTSGKYSAKITALCEGVSMQSLNFIIQVNAAPQITFNYPAEMTICEGQSVTLTTQQDPAYSYRWYKDGIQLPGEANNSYIAFTPGSYHVEVSNCAGQFTASSVTKLNIDILPKPVLQHNKAIYCKDDIAVLSVNNPMGFKIRWDYNFTELTQFRDQLSITAPGDGKYMVTFINENECIKQSDAYDLVRHPLPLAIITKSTNKTLCYGESVKLTVNATAGASYLWSNGASSREIMVTDPGTYSVQVSSSFGCTAVSNPVEVFVNNKLVLAKPPESKICTFTGEQLTLVADQGYANYSWNGVSTAANTMKVNAPGNYTLEVTDAMGCKANTLFTVIAWCKEVVIANAFSPNNDGNNDAWRVGGLESDPQASLQIYNRFGNLVLQTTGSNAQWDGKIKGKDAPVGVYYYVIKSRQSAVPLKGSITLIR